MRISKILYSTYHPLRASFRQMGIILMYGAYTNSFAPLLFLVAAAVFCIELFGIVYEDYWNYEEDIHNVKKDKLIVAGLLSRLQTRNLSFFILSVALVLLWFTSPLIMIVGLVYVSGMFFYSYPTTYFKHFNLGVYLLGGAVLAAIPISLNLLFMRPFLIIDIAFILFVGFQYVYLLCQKDSTDPNDKMNLFVGRGWHNATLICALFATLSSISLFALSLFNVKLLIVWALNAVAKFVNIQKIYIQQITRPLRDKVVLIESITPYLFIAIALL